MTTYQTIQVTPHLTREIWYGGKMIVHRLTSSSRETVDAYIDSVLADIRTWDRSQPYYNVQDVSHHSVQLTTYMRGRLDEVAVAIRQRDLTTYAAVILPPGLVARLMTAYGALFTRRGGKINQRYFDRTDKGFAWVEQQMKETV
jgi:hypothetical protein